LDKGFVEFFKKFMGGAKSYKGLQEIGIMAGE
jgi:hypothetical protein